LEYSTLGKHIIADFWGVNASLLDDILFMESLTRIAAKKCGATIISTSSHKFQPHGCTVLILLSESHISAHCYPEFGYASLDIYTCGNKADPQIAINFLRDALEPKFIKQHVLTRGEK
jgi:S-adenosylmethionine decarboxylase